MDSQSSEEEEDGQMRAKPSSRSQGGKSSAGRSRQHESGVGSRQGEGCQVQAITMSRSPGATPHLAVHGEYSPDNYRVPGEGTAAGSPRLNGSVGTSSMSRMSRKSLREIPRTDARLSLAKTSEVFDKCFWSKCVLENLFDLVPPWLSNLNNNFHSHK